MRHTWSPLLTVIALSVFYVIRKKRRQEATRRFQETYKNAGLFQAQVPIEEAQEAGPLPDKLPIINVSPYNPDVRITP